MNRWEAFSDDGVFDMKQRLKQMDTDKVQKKIESMIYAINKRNKSFVLLLELDVWSVLLLLKSSHTCL